MDSDTRESLLAVIRDFDASPPEERKPRFVLLSRLFAFYGETNADRLEVYLQETDEIPLDKLSLAVKAALRTHRYPSVPRIADLWSMARSAAGMDREQYHAGYYVPPPREWPPAGKRYAIEAGRLEPLRSVNPQLGSGESRQQIAESSAEGESLE